MIRLLVRLPVMKLFQQSKRVVIVCVICVVILVALFCRSRFHFQMDVMYSVLREVGIQGANNWKVAVDPVTLRLSEHPDIEVRGKFQKTQIRKMCETYFPGEPPDLFATPETDFFWHLIFEDKQRILFCYVPKVGSTNIRRMLYYMSGSLPLETLNVAWPDYQKYYVPATMRASLANNTLTKEQKEHRMNNYYKFMFVRHPLERVVSAFKDKVEPPLNPKALHLFPNNNKYTILKIYRPEELAKWQRANEIRPWSYNISVTFNEFCHYIVEEDSVSLNEHFRPSMDICHPCLLQYDFYGSFRNISADSSQLIKKFKTDPKLYRDESVHRPHDQTRLKLHSYYQLLNHQERMKLFKWLHSELLFYYTLYPSEIYLQRDLLGIDTPSSLNGTINL